MAFFLEAFEIRRLSETLNNYTDQTDEKTLKYENKMMRKAVLYFKMTTS